MLHDLVGAEVFVCNRVQCVTKTTSATLWRLNKYSSETFGFWCGDLTGRVSFAGLGVVSGSRVVRRLHPGPEAEPECPGSV